MRKHFNLKPSLLSAAIMSVIASSNSFAQNFRINPTPGLPLPTKIYPGGRVSAFYNVTNRTSKKLSNYSIQQLPPHVKQNTSGSNCPALITLAAKSTCRLQLDITAPVTNGTFVIQKGSNITTAGVPLNVRRVKTIPALFLSVGINESISPNPPLIARSQSGGETWTYPALPDTVPNAGLLNVSCYRSSCAAVGEDLTTNIPVIIQSQNGGQTWSYPSLGLTQVGFLQGISCYGTRCVAAGPQESGIPLLAQSDDSGQTWSYPAIAPANPNVYLNNASCYGNNCIVTGEDFNIEVPVIAYSQNGGSWTYAQLNPPIPSSGFLFGSSCYGSNCVAVGLGSGVLIVQSQDGGQTWSYPNLPIETPEVFFTSVSCYKNMCAAGGEDSSGDPFIAQSVDSGQTWTYPNLPASVPTGIFWSVSCSQNICAAAGEDFSNALPLIAQSVDGGQTWTYPNLPASVTSGYLWGVSCDRDICVASGGNYTNTNTTPLIVHTQDGGQTWTYPALPASVTSGYLYGAGSNSVSFLPKSLRFLHDSKQTHRGLRHNRIMAHQLIERLRQSRR